MADTRGLKTLFQAEGIEVYGAVEEPCTVSICINGEWKTLTAEEAVTLSVALNNHAYPATHPRQ